MNNQKEKSPEHVARAEMSLNNYKNENAMLQEMQSAGYKVKRIDELWGWVYRLESPITVYFETQGAHTYGPNATRELYDMWVAAGKPSLNQIPPDANPVIDEYLRTFSDGGLYPEFVAAVQQLRAENTELKAKLNRIMGLVLAFEAELT